MQNLIFWFFNKYGLYFYVEKFKLANNKILLQIYYYKTYLFFRQYYKSSIFRTSGLVNLKHKRSFLSKHSKNSSYYFFNFLKHFVFRKNKNFKRSIRNKKFFLERYQKNVRFFLKKLNILSKIFLRVKISPNRVRKILLSIKLYRILSKLHSYFKYLNVSRKQQLFLNINNFQFFLILKPKAGLTNPENNHIVKYLATPVVKFKVPTNWYWKKVIFERYDEKRLARRLLLLEKLTPDSKEKKDAPEQEQIQRKKQLTNSNRSLKAVPPVRKPFFKKHFRKNKKVQIAPKLIKRNRGLARLKESFTFNFFFTYYFAFFFGCQTHLLYKSLYKYMFIHKTLRKEYNVITKRSKYLRKRNMWAFDFLFFLHYSVTFANTLFLWPFLVYHLKRTFKRHGSTMQLIINVLRTIFFLKPYFKGFKLMIKGPYDRHGRSRKILLHLGHMGFSKYMFHPILYDMIHCPIVYGMCSIKFWMAYE